MLDYVVIEYGGYPNNSANLIADKASVAITNSTIARGSQHGIVAKNGGIVSVTNTAFDSNGSGNLDYPIYLGDPGSDSTFSSVTMTGNYNGNNAVGIAGGTITSAVRWELPGTGVPYHLLGPITVGTGGTLTIDPGVTVKLKFYELAVESGGKL
jgi:hypothetical protein